MNRWEGELGLVCCVAVLTRKDILLTQLWRRFFNITEIATVRFPSLVWNDGDSDATH